MSYLDDASIAELIGEPKPQVALDDLIPRELERRFRRARVEVLAPSGSKFTLMTRQALADADDFSVILGYEMPDLHRTFRLMRNNGSNHRHPNRLEGNVVAGCHIHTATARYQEAGFEEDGFAEATSVYVDVTGAIQHMLDAATFTPPAQGTLLAP